MMLSLLLLADPPPAPEEPAKTTASTAPGAPGDPPWRHVEFSEVTALKTVPPRYPDAAKTHRWEARCVSRVYLDRSGIPEAVLVEECPVVFTDTVLASVFQWRFRPVVVDGVAVPAEFQLMTRFDLANETGMTAPPGTSDSTPTAMVRTPRPVILVEPTFPPDSRRRGPCTLRVVIDTNGKPIDVNPVDCPSALEDEAIAAAEASTWRPVVLAGSARIAAFELVYGAP